MACYLWTTPRTAPSTSAAELCAHICKLAAQLHFSLFSLSKNGKRNFQHMEAFLHSEIFRGEGGVGGWEHNLQLRVRRNMYFRVRLIRPGSTWQKSSTEKQKNRLCPQFSICEISTSQSVQHLPRHKSQTTLGLDHHCDLLCRVPTGPAQAWTGR